MKIYINYIPLLLVAAVFFLLNTSGAYHARSSTMLDYAYRETLFTRLLGIFVFLFYSLRFIIMRRPISRMMNIQTYLILLIASLWGLVYFIEGMSSVPFASYVTAAIFPLFLVMFSEVQTMQNEAFVQHVKQVFLAFSVVCILCAFRELAHVGPYILPGKTPLMQFQTLAFWALFFCICIENKIHTKKYIFYAVCFITTLYLGAIMISRSMVLQSAFALILLSCFFFRDARSKITILAILSIILVFVIPLLFGIFKESQSFAFFVAKLTRDSRSAQYISIFNQVDLCGWLIGKGYFFRYIDKNSYNSYIDNQTLLMMARYGLFVVFAYYTILITPILKLILTKRFCRMIWFVFLWILALNGLSVYHTIQFDIINYISVLAVGVCWKQANQRISLPRI